MFIYICIRALLQDILNWVLESDLLCHAIRKDRRCTSTRESIILTPRPPPKNAAPLRAIYLALCSNVMADLIKRTKRPTPLSISWHVMADSSLLRKWQMALAPLTSTNQFDLPFAQLIYSTVFNFKLKCRLDMCFPFNRQVHEQQEWNSSV